MVRSRCLGSVQSTVTPDHSTSTLVLSGGKDCLNHNQQHSHSHSQSGHAISASGDQQQLSGHQDWVEGRVAKHPPTVKKCKISSSNFAYSKPELRRRIKMKPSANYDSNRSSLRAVFVCFVSMKNSCSSRKSQRVLAVLCRGISYLVVLEIVC